MAATTTTRTGPLFDGEFAKAMEEGMHDARHQLADRGEVLVRGIFTARIRQPTGRFDRSITQTSESRTYVTGKYALPVVVEDNATDIVVTTDLATYGPWLEGTGSRNLTTRFKGYHAFREATGQLETEAARIAGEAIAERLKAVSA